MNTPSARRGGARRRGRGSAPAASPTRLNRRPAGGAQDEGVPLRRNAPPPPPPPAPGRTLVSSLGAVLAEKLQAGLVEGGGLLDEVHVAGVGNAPELRGGDQGVELRRGRGWHEDVFGPRGD